MTNYRLPDWLGGLQVEVVGQRGDGQLICMPHTPEGVVVTLNPTTVHIDVELLVEVTE